MPRLRHISAALTSLLAVVLVPVLAVLLAACASFHPLPLATHAVAVAADKVRPSAASMPVSTLANHVFDARDGLDEAETALLAVANNPQLKVLRDDLGIAHAQAFAAGLLPDPQVSWSQDFVTGGSGAHPTSPFGLGISWNVGALLTRSTRKAAAHWNEKQFDLKLLWAEWQTVARARVLFEQVVSQRALVARLQTETAALHPLQGSIDKAVNSGDLSADLAVTGLSAAADVRQKLTSAQTALARSEHDLQLLLGLKAQTPLHLVGGARTITPSAAQVQTALADLPRRRPDLLALQAGYQSQNEKLRVAILNQFPAINVGFNRARDNSAVYTSGFTIGLTLPLFDRNRGNIAIARATRQRLHDDYSARLLTTENDVDRLDAQLRLDQSALPQTTAHAAQLDAALRRAETAWRAHQLDLPTYLSLRSNALTADLQLIALRQTTAATGIALQTLLGGDWSRSASARLHADAPPPPSSSASAPAKRTPSSTAPNTP